MRRVAAILRDSRLPSALTCALLAAGIVAAQQAPKVTVTDKRISNAEIAKHLDHAWVKKALVNDLLDYWVKYSVKPNGFIQENLDRQWKEFGEPSASLNGQGRVLYTFAVGYEVSGKDKKYLDAVTKGADFLLKMHDDQFGGYYNRTTPDLKVTDDTKGGFQSFAIFSLAHAARVTGNQKYAKAALDVYHELKAKMSDGPFITGNFKRDFSGPAAMNMGGMGGGRGAGAGGRGAAGAPGAPAGAPGAPTGAPGGPAGAPGAPAGAPGGRGGFGMAAGGHGLNLHMFEALMGLYEATRSKEVWDTIQGELDVIAKVYNYKEGYLSESYDKDWKEVGNPLGNPGHIFEWASLLSHAVELGADPKFIEMGSRNLDYGLKAWDKEVGGLSPRNQQGQPSYMLWWPQCEVAKATANYAILHGRSDLWPVFEKTMNFIKTNYFDTEQGGWFEGYKVGMKSREELGARAFIKGAVDGPELSPYHMTSMYHDMWRISDPKYKVFRDQK
jgi:cellobiose epimerase